MYDDNEDPCVWGSGDPRLWALRARDRGEIETAAQRHGGDFPAHWGTPPGSRFSEERAAWVRSNVETHQIEQWIRGGSARAALALVRAMQKSD